MTMARLVIYGQSSHLYNHCGDSIIWALGQFIFCGFSFPGWCVPHLLSSQPAFDKQNQWEESDLCNDYHDSVTWARKDRTSSIAHLTTALFSNRSSSFSGGHKPRSTCGYLWFYLRRIPCLSSSLLELLLFIFFPWAPRSELQTFQ